ncbi:hypothetical protein GGS26DRAFT_576157 [Hypomontagnella submonticulosa]|nr:hypothetical protein GGS26DRAFT_576157 [Hypomontagnella submonticulosa]
MSTAFTLFPRLPPELRLMIWKEALVYESSRHYIACGSHRAKRKIEKTGYSVWLRPTPDIASVILRVCCESRALALEFYPNVLPVRLVEIHRKAREKERGCVHLDLKRVRLAHLPRLPLTDDKQMMTRILTMEERNSVRNIVSLRIPSLYVYPEFNNSTKARRLFPKLESTEYLGILEDIQETALAMPIMELIQEVRKFYERYTGGLKASVCRGSWK